jgi:hypothetical protein
MRLSTLIAVILALGACAWSRPMSTEEYKGFCYQDGGPELTCPRVAICDSYLPALETEQDLNGCLQACADINKNFQDQSPTLGCTNFSAEAKDWCQRACRRNHVN